MTSTLAYFLPFLRAIMRLAAIREVMPCPSRSFATSSSLSGVFWGSFSWPWPSLLGIVVGISARGLIGTVQSLLRDDVQPTLRSARQTVDSIRGTTSFVAETAVAPVIRVYGIFSGVRRFLSVLVGFRKRRSR